MNSQGLVPGVTVTGSPFCEHKKLRLTCAACKAASTPPVVKTMQATPYLSRDDRDKLAERKVARRTTTVVDPRSRETKEVKLGGPGKPLMPVRAKKKGISADEAEQAEAWWVKRG